MNLKEWLEKKYLNWQLQFGRATIEEFANHIGISKSYATLLLNGQRSNVSMEKAIQIGNKLNDYEILDILGYARPLNEQISDDQLAPIAALILKFPEGIRPQIRSAIMEALKVLTQDNQIPTEEETLKLIVEKILSEIDK